jgi:hypothetical protein
MKKTTVKNKLRKKRNTFKNKLRKKRNTFKNKLRKTSKKNKNLIGGDKPKITFPYTYYYVTREDLTKYNKLNSYINIQTKYCNWTTTPQVSDFDMPATDDMAANFLNNDNEILIIFVRYDIADKLIKDQLIAGHPTTTTYFNDLNFLNDQILGHAKIIKYPTVDILGIYNICVHKITVQITIHDTLDYKQIIEKEEKTTNSGTVLISCTILAIAFLPVSFTGKTFKYLWLGIDLKNVQFDKLVHMYTSIGFKYPSISNIMPNGEKIPGGMMIMQFFKEITNYTNNINDTIIPEMEALDLFDQYNKYPLAKNGIFYYNFALDKSAILSLRMLPYLSFDLTTMNVKGINTFDEQVETSGTLILNNIQDKYDKDVEYNFITHVLSLEPISRDDSSIKFNKGDREMKAVLVTPAQRSFHTHPYIMYDYFNTIMGPPSGGDCKVFLNDVMNYMYDTKKSAIQEHNPAQLPVQLRLVVAIEGIYVMSMTVAGIEYLKNNEDILSYNKEKFLDYIDGVTETLGKTDIRQKFEWAQHKNDKIDPEMVKTEIDKYIKFINDVKIDDVKIDDVTIYGVNIIKVTFFSWKDIKPNTIIGVQYYNGNNIMTDNKTQFEQQQPIVQPIGQPIGQRQPIVQSIQPNRQQPIVQRQPNGQPIVQLTTAQQQQQQQQVQQLLQIKKRRQQTPTQKQNQEKFGY